VLRRAQQCGSRVLLAIQDTTACNFNIRNTLEGLGSITQGAQNIAGRHVHSTLLSAADKDAVFGLLGARFYARKLPGKERSVGARNREPIEGARSLHLANEVSGMLRSRAAEPPCCGVGTPRSGAAATIQTTC
jgi:hypothetical protein